MEFPAGGGGTEVLLLSCFSQPYGRLWIVLPPGFVKIFPTALPTTKYFFYEATGLA